MPSTPCGRYPGAAPRDRSRGGERLDDKSAMTRSRSTALRSFPSRSTARNWRSPPWCRRQRLITTSDSAATEGTTGPGGALASLSRLALQARLPGLIPRFGVDALHVSLDPGLVTRPTSRPSPSTTESHPTLWCLITAAASSIPSSAATTSSRLATSLILMESRSPLAATTSDMLRAVTWPKNRSSESTTRRAKTSSSDDSLGRFANGALAPDPVGVRWLHHVRHLVSVRIIRAFGGSGCFRRLLVHCPDERERMAQCCSGQLLTFQRPNRPPNRWAPRSESAPSSC